MAVLASRLSELLESMDMVLWPALHEKMQIENSNQGMPC